jgi:hypothetical protein
MIKQEKSLSPLGVIFTKKAKKPYYHSKRITDFEKIRLMYISPAPFRQRNVYFDLESISRV